MADAGAYFRSAADDAQGYRAQQELPWAISPDSTLWAQGREKDPTAVRLAEQFVALQSDADRRMFDALTDLVGHMGALPAFGEQTPPQVLGRLDQPDGSPAARVQVALPAATTGEARAASAITGADGTFVLALPAAARVAGIPRDLVVTSGSGSRTLHGALDVLQPTGVLAPIRLPEPVDPLALNVIAALERIVDGAPVGDAPAAAGAHPALAVGEDECQIVFSKDRSSDRFPYGVLFRLTDPALSQPSLRFGFEGRGAAGEVSFYGPNSPAALLAGGLDRLTFRLTERVPIDRPISIDAFRDGIAAERPWGGVPIAGSLALGYTVRMAQRWTPLGLSLGDLVYSLPLAPGEQQRVAVVERTSSTSVIETERLESSEQMSFTERDDTSATATFASAFTEVASGGSHYDTEASSFSVAAAAGGGGVFPFGCAAGGVATSFGTSSSSGNTATWMSGARNSTSDVAQQTHSAVNRQAAARRSSSRTAMRLATATESDQVVTKVITNHNKTRALTVQYWEVQRLFDVTTVAEGVNLVCMVPLDLIRFLPAGLPSQPTAAPSTRDDVLRRYGQLLRHADIVGRVVPSRYRRGLSLIADFAADPTTSVGSSAGPAEDLLDITVDASLLPFEDLYVSVVGKRGLRLGPVRLEGASAIALPEGTGALSSEEALFGWLRTHRRSDLTTGLAARFALPASFARQDIVGFELTRRFRRLDYRFAPPAISDVQQAGALLGPLGSLGEAIIGAAVSSPSVSRSYGGDRLERELAGPRIAKFGALLSGSVQIAAGGSTVDDLPTGVYPMAALTVPPQLSYTSVLEIEKTLQWVMRNTMTCTVAVFASLTPEERTVMLERYEITLPPDENGQARNPVPLLSCITNNVLGYYGNSMVLPFMIPAEMTLAMGVDDNDQPRLTTGKIQDALTRFHTDGFDPPRSVIALPTHGVLGEAVLGHCPSAEKIDLTRFWNWQDSPADAATAIGEVTVPTGSMTSGLTAPSALTGLTPQIQNFSMAPVAADTSLASALITAAAQGKDFDIAALTNSGNLATLTGKTLGTAESARKDALASATQLAEKAMETSASIYNGGGGGGKKGDAPGGGGDTPTPTPTPAPTPTPTPTPTPQPPRPASASIHFALDSSSLTAAPASAELAALDAAATAAKTASATGAVVRGYASPEGAPAHNVDLAHNRADAIIAHLQTLGITATRAEGGVLAGSPGDYPALRRADVAFTY